MLSERAGRDCWLDLLPGEGFLIEVLWGRGTIWLFLQSPMWNPMS